MANPPNAWQVEAALSAWHSTRQRLAEDTPDDDMDALLGAADGDVADVLTRALRAAEEAKSMAAAADERAKLILERRDRFKRRAENLRGLAFAIMDAIGEQKFVLPDLSATIRAGTQGVQIIDETALPDEYTVTERRPDRAKISADLKQGVVITGAALSNGLPSLQIRSK